MPTPCTVQDCGRPARARGLCDSHRKQLARTGSLAVIRSRGEPRVPVPWRVPWYLLDLARQAAELEGVEPGAWLEEALLRALPLDKLEG